MLAQPETLNIWTAASEGKTEKVLEMLRENGSLINQADQNGYTPLFAAISWDHLDLVQALLENGADIMQCDSSDGDSSLHVASSVECCRILLQRTSALLTMRNFEGRLPVEIQYRDGNMEIVEFLQSLMPSDLTWERLEEDDDEAEKIDLEALEYLLNPERIDVVDQDIYMTED